MKRLNPVLFTAVVISFFAVVPALAQYSSPRQYYSSYRQAPGKSYSYRVYYYKPTPTYAGYKHNYVIYPLSDPKHAYYYNPYKKSYWGRCPVQTQGKPLYSLLKPEHRKPKLEQIAEDEFPSPSDQLPPIPESIDSVVIDLPPDDLPADIP